MEERITFSAETTEIEGLLQENRGTGGVVITHPHPLYGGNMHNKVSGVGLQVSGARIAKM